MYKYFFIGSIITISLSFFVINYDYIFLGKIESGYSKKSIVKKTIEYIENPKEFFNKNRNIRTICVRWESLSGFMGTIEPFSFGKIDAKKRTYFPFMDGKVAIFFAYKDKKIDIIYTGNLKIRTVLRKHPKDGVFCQKLALNGENHGFLG